LVVTRFRGYRWVALLCAVLIALTVVAAASGVPFDGVLVLIGTLFGLVVVARVPSVRSFLPPIQFVVCVLPGRAPPPAQ